MESSIKLFGKRINTIRKKNNLTQEQLADILNIDPKTISRLENGYFFTSYENLEKIASALNVEIKDLFDFGHLKDRNKLEENIINHIHTMPTDKLQKLAKFIQDFI